MYCNSLVEITISNSVTNIGSSAFFFFFRLIEVYNQSTLEITAGSSDHGYVAYYAKNVYTQENGSWFTDTEEGYRFFYDGNKGYLVWYHGAETTLALPTGFTAHDGTEVIGYEIYTYSFVECKQLKFLTVPEGVTAIEHGAFNGCSNLTEIVISDTVTSIGDLAFYNCSSLTAITIPASVTSIGLQAFSGCSSLTEIVVPDSVMSIEREAFSGTAFYNDETNWENGVLYIWESSDQSRNNNYRFLYYKKWYIDDCRRGI